MARDRVIIHNAIYDAFDSVSDGLKQSLWSAIIEYTSKGVEPKNLNGHYRTLFILAKALINEQNGNYDGSSDFWKPSKGGKNGRK